MLQCYSVKTMICGVAINSLEITLIFQQARNDVKIGPAGAVCGNRLCDHFLRENRKVISRPPI